MEKENFYSNGGSPPSSSYGATSTSPPTHPTWLSSSLAMDIQVAELNCSSGQLPNSFLNLNWENSLDQSAPFESAMSSIVSSPGTSNAATFPSESVVIRELIGRLGSICNSGEISPQSQNLGFNGASFMGGNNSTNNSCYSTPLNSPPKLNLSMIDHQFKGNLPISGNSKSTHPNLVPLSADPGFAERAAKFSCFGSRRFNGLMGEFGLNETEFAYRSMPKIENGKLSRISSSPSLQDGLETDMRSASASGQIPGVDPGLKGSNDINGRKRKTAPRGKVNDLSSSSSVKDVKMVIEDEDSNAKRCKSDEDAVKEKKEANGNANTAKDQKQNKDNQKPPEPPKDYIHVRARRGQATDSHSLAERVRREKISERMKFLQDLVPGCNKVTGKAVMLDEIINYVQSLQRQVEFLSMKLATVNPKLDFNMETLLSKTNEASIHTIYPLDASASAFPYGHQLQQGPPLESSISNVNSLDSILHRSLSMQLPPSDGFGEAASQLATFWENDLQSIVQMGFNQNQNPETEFQPQSFLGSLATTHMKIEL